MSLLQPAQTPFREGLRRTIPAISVFLAMVVMVLPVPFAWGVMPHFALLLVLIWAGIQPRFMQPWAAFLLGLLFDIIVGLPIGHTALIFAAVVAVVRFAEVWVDGHSLFFDWLFAGVVILGAQMLSMQILRMVGHSTPLGPMLAQAVLTILAFPLMVVLAARIQRRLVETGA